VKVFGFSGSNPICCTVTVIISVCNDAKFCASGEGVLKDGDWSVMAYDDKLGQRLPMTAFEHLLLNETSGKFGGTEYCDYRSIVL